MGLTETNIFKSPLPYQGMPREKTVEVYSFEELRNDSIATPHRHKFDMILWASKGRGSHDVDYQTYDMFPGRLFLLRQGQIHYVNQYAEDGIIILIKENAGLRLDSDVWGSFYNKPYIDLNQLHCDTFMGLFSFLQIEARHLSPDIAIIENLLNGMFLALKRQIGPSIKHNLSVELNLHLKVRDLIEQHYKKHKQPRFFCDQLKITSRKLNEIVKAVEGKSFHQLLQDRLLIESKSLLTSTTYTVKEIAYSLGFEDPAYFGRFFKKNEGVTPQVYREIRGNVN